MSSSDRKERARVAAVRDAQADGGIVKEVFVDEPNLVGKPPQSIVVRVTIRMSQGQ